MKALITVAVVFVLFTSPSYGSEFWANQLGGGPTEVLENYTKSGKYSGRIQTATAEPEVDDNGEVTYSIETDSEANMTVLDFEGTSDLEIVDVDTGENIEPLVTETARRSGKAQLRQGKLRAGNWKVRIRNRNNRTANPAIIVDHSDSDYSLIVTSENSTTAQGNRVKVTAMISSNWDGLDANDLEIGEPIQVTNEQFRARIGGRSVNLLDNGGGADDRRNDGIYSAFVNANEIGNNEIYIVARGRINGNLIHRTGYLNSNNSGNRIRTVDQSVVATQGQILETPTEEERYGLPIRFTLLNGTMPDYLDTRAEVWGKDQEGNDAVIGWIGGIVEPSHIRSKRWTVPFTFHSGWLTFESEYFPPYTLRNIEVKDIDIGDNMVVASTGTIEIENIVQNKKSNSVISRSSLKGDPPLSMLKGTHPSLLNSSDGSKIESRGISARSGFTPKVVFLHGWCDRAKSIGHFSSTIRNKAFNYNRSRKGESATRYATEVMASIGWNPGYIRGIVAHSHGGMAAATLLNNYSYAFADNARSAPPNIISVGTPYEGTRLLDSVDSGIFRTILQSIVREVTNGCTIPSELFRNTNNSWDSQIGWRARFQTRAFTTQHSDSKHAFDTRDCGGWASAIIRTSDDGVLSTYDGNEFADGGYTHTKKYCHGPGFGNQGDQWRLPAFVNAVNQTFHAPFEEWQPY